MNATHAGQRRALRFRLRDPGRVLVQEIARATVTSVARLAPRRCAELVFLPSGIRWTRTVLVSQALRKWRR